ncbi:MAG: DegT/DnrJ/EryC1/StrS family aminotransferase [Bacteroidia bacterium]|nr:DegT/DnrJ/EryC1/StrS family aminotransferase [Bacteroidia bacterium]
MIFVTKTFLPDLDEYISVLRKIWDTSQVTNRGPLVLKLEEKLKEYLQVNKILLVSNGTIALQIAIKALELKGEIITTPFSYVATTSSIVWENCKPVFVDIHPECLTIDEEKIEAAITKNTTAILATHVYGNPCNVEAIKNIAESYNLKVIYDAAHCFGVKYKNKSILEYGDVSTLSLHATKLFHTGEGGAIICHSEELFHKIYYHHNFGHNGEEEFWGLGINGKMSELNVALGLSVLPYMTEMINMRRKAVDLYKELLSNNESIRFLKIRDETEWNYSYFPIILSSEDQLLHIREILRKNNIFPRRYFYPSLNKLPYLTYQKMPHAEDISRRILCLPLYHDVQNEVERISDLILKNLSS